MNCQEKDNLSSTHNNTKMKNRDISYKIPTISTNIIFDNSLFPFSHFFHRRESSKKRKREENEEKKEKHKKWNLKNTFSLNKAKQAKIKIK